MRVLLRQVVRRTDGGIEYHDRELDVDVLTIGRAGDQDLALPGSRVSLRHARIRLRRGGECEIATVAAAELTVNDHSVTTARIDRGDRVGIGASLLKRINAPEGFGLAFEIEQREEKEAASAVAIGTADAAGWSRRRWSWALGLFFLLAGLIVPLVGAYLPQVQQLLRATHVLPNDHWWDSGPLIPAHATLPPDQDCTACHLTPFRMVSDEACAECHSDITQHAATDTGLGAALADRRCASCHKEHAGPVAIVRRDSAFCADCHASLKSGLGAKTALQDVQNFARQHPEFRPVFLRPPSDPAGADPAGADPAGASHWTRIRLALGDPNTREQSNLRFTHKAHLDPAGVDSPDGKKQMNCGSCHEPDLGGGTMLPVEMKRHCSSCHTLGFESVSLPHGSVEQVLNVLRGYYLGPKAAAAVPVREDIMIAKRRKARRPGAEPEVPAAALTPEGRVQRAARDLFERTLCIDCHTVDRSEHEPIEAAWRIQPVRVNPRWMPSAHFSHKSHAQRPCDECHKAGVSEQSEDVLIPDIRVCRECHAGNAVTAGLRSPCIECHDFHLPGQPTLIPQTNRATLGINHENL